MEGVLRGSSMAAERIGGFWGVERRGEGEDVMRRKCLRVCRDEDRKKRGTDGKVVISSKP